MYVSLKQLSGNGHFPSLWPERLQRTLVICFTVIGSTNTSIISCNILVGGGGGGSWTNTVKWAVNAREELEVQRIRLWLLRQKP